MEAESNLARYIQMLADSPSSEHNALSVLLAREPFSSMMCSIWTASPYLSHLLHTRPYIVYRLLTRGPDICLNIILQHVREKHFKNEAELMHAIRQMKSEAALMIALSDIWDIVPLATTTIYLSRVAETALACVCDFLLHQAYIKGDITLIDSRAPSEGSGLIVLGMGKLGAYELNYSSDIDLIILFDKEKVEYRGRHSVQQFFNKLAQEIVRFMQERTQDGYVFRTDLRLRPDPASTPLANSVGAAITYYETVGQNWERAALIKARPVAGDIAAGKRFLASITYFIWRKHLDFAAIADIQSIKRQMDTRGSGQINIAGHNIKLGLGGIREIEFYTQIHQLIWGGRMPQLRTRATCETLSLLAKAGLITEEISQRLIKAYIFYRKIEHRLQMVADIQTHTLPQETVALEKISRFCGYAQYESFRAELQESLQEVHRIYSQSFKGQRPLGDKGNLVFTGVGHDPGTLETIASLGYQNPTLVSECIQGWHHGRRRSTRTKRARELITELTPALLRALAATSAPDDAFIRFDHFLGDLPAGVQLFSVFNQNPDLLSLIADIMGNAPALANRLSKHPHLLDVVLTRSFYDHLPSQITLENQLNGMLQYSTGFEEALNMLLLFKNETQFQAGMQFLQKNCPLQAIGIFLTQVADCLLTAVQKLVEKEFALQHGVIINSSLSMVGLGRLGACEMQFDSDIDIFFVYSADADAKSDGERSLPASTYYTRLVGRITNAITALNKHGKLFDIDTRLRPYGSDGPLAIHLEGMKDYYSKSAWIFEFMALTKARTITGHQALQSSIMHTIEHCLSTERLPAQLQQDVLAMRSRISKQFPHASLWDVKHVRGGLMDIDFIAQYLWLLHAPSINLKGGLSAKSVLDRALDKQYITPTQHHLLLEARVVQNYILAMKRFCGQQIFDDVNARSSQPLLKRLLEIEDLDALKTALAKLQADVYATFQILIPAL